MKSMMGRAPIGYNGRCQLNGHICLLAASALALEGFWE